MKTRVDATNDASDVAKQDDTEDGWKSVLWIAVVKVENEDGETDGQRPKTHRTRQIDDCAETQRDKTLFWFWFSDLHMWMVGYQMTKN